uniref:Uncharacterized protein n=1 Tax=Rickettsia felis TaxID=42862 RepID=D4N378_RICFI|nr:unknown [Rickettsia felis]
MILNLCIKRILQNTQCSVTTLFRIGYTCVERGFVRKGMYCDLLDVIILFWNRQVK